MKRFRFPLERLLWHRELQEGLAEQALAGALTEERTAKEALARVREETRTEADALRRDLAAPMQGDEFRLHARFSAALKEREAALGRRRAAAAELIRERREALRERRRAREVVTQLRRGAWERYRQEEAREAQLALDEVGGGLHRRRQRETEE